jgi:hypothetical protein
MVKQAQVAVEVAPVKESIRLVATVVRVLSFFPLGLVCRLLGQQLPQELEATSHNPFRLGPEMVLVNTTSQ